MWVATCSDNNSDPLNFISDVRYITADMCTTCFMAILKTFHRQQHADCRVPSWIEVDSWTAGLMIRRLQCVVASGRRLSWGNPWRLGSDSKTQSDTVRPRHVAFRKHLDCCGGRPDGLRLNETHNAEEFSEGNNRR